MHNPAPKLVCNVEALHCLNGNQGEPVPCFTAKAGRKPSPLLPHDGDQGSRRVSSLRLPLDVAEGFASGDPVLMAGKAKGKKRLGGPRPAQKPAKRRREVCDQRCLAACRHTIACIAWVRTLYPEFRKLS